MTLQVIGKYNGTQQKFSEICQRNILYIPCQEHLINILIESACNANTIINEFFGTLESLYVFFSGNTSRHQRLQEELKGVENSLRLKNLSKTRWTARAESIKAVAVSYESVVHVLEDMKSSKHFDSNTKCSAIALYKKILDFDFICILFFLKNVMFKVKNITEAEKLNIIDAMKLIESTVKSFQELNDEIQIDA